MYCPGLGLATQCLEEVQVQLATTLAQVRQSSQMIQKSSIWVQDCLAYLLLPLPRSDWQSGAEDPAEALPYSCLGVANEIQVYFGIIICMGHHCLTLECCPG